MQNSKRVCALFLGALLAVVVSQAPAADFGSGSAATSSLPAALSALNVGADSVTSQQAASEVRGQGGCCAPPIQIPPWLYCYRPTPSVPSYPGPHGPPAPPAPPGPPKPPTGPHYGPKPAPHGGWGSIAGGPKGGWGGGPPSFGVGCFK